MYLSWLVLCACAALARSAAVSTETLVVTSSDDVTTRPPATEGPQQATTEAPPPPLKMLEMNVTSLVALRYARTAVATRVRNPAARAQEATFRVLLPETAFISGFVMTLDGKSYKAYVKEKEEAKKVYNDAVAQGVSAAHVATKARDSNHFTVSVNVAAGTEASFNLTYEELLVRRNGVYNVAVNLHPGRAVPALAVTVRVREARRLSVLRVPAVRTGNEVDATADDEQNPLAVVERGHDDREATVTFRPSLAEQQRLMDLYAEKSMESSRSRHGYGRGHGDAAGALGQFVVQYDVDRPKDGEILVNDGYFVHFLAPASLPPLARHVVFALDTSGSMMNRKMEQLRAALAAILAELRPGDYVSLVEFASSVQVHDLKEADEEPRKHSYSYFDESRKPVTLVPPFPATPANVAKAQVIVSRLRADGGTNIDSALKVAIDLVRKGVHWTPAAAAAPAPAPGANSTLDKADEPVALPVKTESEEPAPSDEPEPMIIFLTDGEPTVGVTDTRRIINNLVEANSGPRKASIFSLAFGEDADRAFLRRLSLLSDGFMRHIYEAADAALQLRDFYRQVASPLLAHVTFAYPPEQVKADSLTTHKFRAYYGGGEMVVAGRLAAAAGAGEGAALTPDVEAFCGTEGKMKKQKYRISPPLPAPRPAGEFLPLERLWAYLTVRQLLDERDRRDEPAAAAVEEEASAAGGAAAASWGVASASGGAVAASGGEAAATGGVAVNTGGAAAASGGSVFVSGGVTAASGGAAAASGGMASASGGMASASGGVASGGTVTASGGAAVASGGAASATGGAAAGAGTRGPGARALELALKYGFVTPLTSLVVVKPNATKTVDAESVDNPIASPFGLAQRFKFITHRRRVVPSDVGRQLHLHETKSVAEYALVPESPLFDALDFEEEVDLSTGTLQTKSSGYRSFGSISMRSSAMSRPLTAGWARPGASNSAGFAGAFDSYRFAPGGQVMGAPPPPWPTHGNYGGYYTTSAPTGPAAPAAAEAGGARYGLREYPWALPLLDAARGVLNLTAHGAALSLKLALYPDDISDAAAAAAACARAVVGGAGECVYLTRCAAARNITRDLYEDTYCTYREGFAGVCCPKA